MSLTTRRLTDLEPAPPDLAAHLPSAGHAFAPTTPESMAAVLAAASDERAPVLVWGAGTHQGLGHAVHPEVVLSTAGLGRVIAWEPDDLTVVVEAGITLGALETLLAERRQTALLPETQPHATIGGVIAAGVSGYRRARFGPTRDRVLQVSVVTGDGRLVTGGGRVVKNVSGYDLPRLVVGSFGSIGVVTSVCLKLWPIPAVEATVATTDPTTAWRTAYRPAAVLQTGDGTFAYLQGTEAEVASQARALGGEARPGFAWPETPDGDVVVSIRVPPARTAAAVERLPGAGPFVAQHGVGEVVAAMEPEPDQLMALRGWTEAEGGAMVVLKAPSSLDVDPWGSDPPGLALQRRLIAAFDPLRILNPGRLPGRI
ncbi:MAG: FAD-binding oxidoreductase [Acidimicrobiia bacterium]